jgi:Mg2+ and Co2+ transporter CorA
MMDREDTTLAETKYRQGEALARLANLGNYDKRLRQNEHKLAVNRIFSEVFMMALSALLIPILVLPFVLNLSPSIEASMEFLYYVILFFFILEYTLKLYYSSDKRKFVLAPIHIFDLFIIIASLLGNLIAFIPQAGGLPILLRLLRLPVAVVLGGRTLSRRSVMRSEVKSRAEGPSLVEAKLSLSSPEKGWEYYRGDTDHDEPKELISQWRHYTNVSDRDVSELGERYGLSGLVLSRRVWEWAYPRAEETGNRVTFLLQVPVVEKSPKYPAVDLIRWVGLLLIDRKEGIITLSRRELPLLDRIPVTAIEKGIRLSTPSVFYLIMSESLDVVEDFIQEAEVELSRLESVPMAQQPHAFLTVTYGVKKEIDHTLAWLVHTREIFRSVLDGKLPLRNWKEEDAIRVKALLEKCDFLLETAEDLAEGLSDDIGFYLNTSSYQMNKVMKVIAVLTALTIIPTVVGGLLGMNIVGVPWNVSLAEVITAVAVIMLFTGWIYFSMGWLRG